MCAIDYAEGSGFWRDPLAEHVAAKDHRCSDCDRTIAKGETYTRGRWMETGEFTGHYDVKVCQHCVTAGRWLKVVCGGHLWPGVVQELHEHWDEEYQLRSAGLARLCVATCKTNGIGRPRAWRRNDGALIPVETVARWVDEALAKVPAEARH